MTDWTSGYIADIGYTFGYYQELNPLRARMPFLNAGMVPPTLGVHCELGFGQGVSTVIHAAAGGSCWHGNDFNPAQAGFAQSLAAAAGADAHLTDESFVQFCQRTDLPDFDSIGLHGIWSWISDANRAVIAEFIGRKLKVGGALYISYNTQPGWAAMVPVRDLLTEYVDVMAAPGAGIVSKIDGALDFVTRLIATNPLYMTANPQVVEKLNKIKEQDRHYVAHEYFNRDWMPMPFSRMAEWLAPAKLDFVCSTNILTQIDPLNLTADQQALLNGIPDPMFRQTVRDFCINQPFRRDYWIKGARTLTPFERDAALRAERFLMTIERSAVTLKVTGSLGESTMAEAIYAPVLDLMGDFKVRSLGEIEQALKGTAISFPQIVQAIVVLIGCGHVSSVRPTEAGDASDLQCKALNLALMQRSRSSVDIAYLASPVTGGGVAVGRIAQLFLLARTEGKNSAAAMADYVWGILQPQNQLLVKEGKPIQSADESLAELRQQAETFIAKQLPILQALHIS
jgi:SAM-dependent methyltransferase